MRQLLYNTSKFPINKVEATRGHQLRGLPPSRRVGQDNRKAIFDRLEQWTHQFAEGWNLIEQ